MMTVLFLIIFYTITGRRLRLSLSLALKDDARWRLSGLKKSTWNKTRPPTVKSSSSLCLCERERLNVASYDPPGFHDPSRHRPPCAPPTTDDSKMIDSCWEYSKLNFCFSFKINCVFMFCLFLFIVWNTQKLLCDGWMTPPPHVNILFEAEEPDRITPAIILLFTEKHTMNSISNSAQLFQLRVRNDNVSRLTWERVVKKNISSNQVTRKYYQHPPCV